MAEFIESILGKPLLVLNSYKFSGSVNKKNNSTGWRCIQRDCNAKVFTENKIVVQDHREHLLHNHKPMIVMQYRGKLLAQRINGKQSMYPQLDRKQLF